MKLKLKKGKSNCTTNIIDTFSSSRFEVRWRERETVEEEEEEEGGGEEVEGGRGGGKRRRRSRSKVCPSLHIPSETPF